MHCHPLTGTRHIILYHIVSYSSIHTMATIAEDDWATQRVQIEIPYIWYIGRNVRINIDFDRLLVAKFSLSVLSVPSQTIIMVKYFYYNSLCIPLRPACVDGHGTFPGPIIDTAAEGATQGSIIIVMIIIMIIMILFLPVFIVSVSCHGLRPCPCWRGCVLIMVLLVPGFILRTCTMDLSKLVYVCCKAILISIIFVIIAVW